MFNPAAYCVVDPNCKIRTAKGLHNPSLLLTFIMALVSGPGRAAGSPSDQQLHVQKHVDYVRNLDTVRDSFYLHLFSLQVIDG